MQIRISYPPLESKKGIPLLSQNRQFQWFKKPTYIYPLVPAYAATLLKARGYDVFWDDGIAEELTFERWFSRLKQEKPDLIALESKTPVIKRHWKIIHKIKNECSWNPIIVLFGDHVTALPRESMANSLVDYVITGGDYDFILADLCDCLSNSTQPNLSQSFPQGVWFRANNDIKNSGSPNLNHNINDLPFINRDLTRWNQYAYKNGNFKFTPGTYVMAGRDCWWGRCRFCSWTTLYPGKTYRTVHPKRHLEEVGRLIRDYKVQEIFDDSGCFPKGKWLQTFCEGIIKSGYNKKVVFGCNQRVGALSQDEWNLMKRANFRFILIGLESVVQSTLDRLNKGIEVKQIEDTIRNAKKAGLEPHVTIMVGYPWETLKDAEQTVEFVKHLFKRGYIDSLQASIVVPYPGTPIFKDAMKNGWLKSKDWNDYDMKKSVWKSPISDEDVLRFTQGLYKTALNPKFIWRKMTSIHNVNDILFLLRAAKKVFAHISDFKTDENFKDNS